jgi:hypothetical protein
MFTNALPDALLQLLSEKTKLLLLVTIVLLICSCNTIKTADINHVILLGQSLAAGQQSLPIVTDSLTNGNNLKFQIATHTWANSFAKNPEKRHHDFFKFSPLIANHNIGETIANGLCDHFSMKSKIEGRLLFSYSGEGGRYLRELDKQHDDAQDIRAKERRSNGGYYSLSIDDIKRAKKTADSLALSYKVLAINWMQGEAEGDRKINRWDAAYPRNEFLEIYKNDLIQLKNDYNSDLSKIFKENLNIPFFTYQTGGTVSGTAQLMACDEEKKMYMVAPTYMMPNAENTYYDYSGKNINEHGDGIHLTADSERWLGEQFGKVIKRVIFDKEKWEPLRPLKATIKRNKNEVFISFKVPRPPLLLDTMFLPKQDMGYGFKIYDENKVTIKIKEVSVVNSTTIKIVTNDPIKKQYSVSYGTISFVKNITKPIFNLTEGITNDHGHKEVLIEFKGNILHEVKVLLDEGMFYLANKETDENLTTIIIRNGYLNEFGNTILVGEKDDLRNGVKFKKGQYCLTSRRYAYGNLHDSDQEKSIFVFSDSSYGNRYNQPYPLYNWCVSFKDLLIE